MFGKIMLKYKQSSLELEYMYYFIMNELKWWIPTPDF